MTSKETLARITGIGVVPVIRAASADAAIQVVDAIVDGGIAIAEITMTVPGAIEVISEVSKRMGADVLVGAGTVTHAETARRCIQAGAQFLVSPGFDQETVTLAKFEQKLIMAGALTPTEVITAWKAGADFVKIFPCGNLGGPKYIKALKGPLPHVPMIPTGGVNLQTAADFIRAGAVALGIGGELVSAAALKSGNTEEITEAAKKYVAIVREARGEQLIAAAAL